MFFFLPFRAKNPPERFPWVTIGLIALNVLIFALTSDYFLFARDGAVEAFGLSHRTLSLWRLFSLMFMHAHLLHLVGNMLFLWIFGSAVEGRLGHVRYLLFYLTVGLAGQICHDLVDGLLHPGRFEIGASGAIMGLAGAYIYLFPFAHILVAYCYSLMLAIRAGVATWQAQWVILYYIGFDILNGVLLRGFIGSGTAHFAHLGGFGAGFLILLATRMRRDSEEVSDAQAVRSDAGNNLLTLSLPELEVLMEGHPGNIPIALAFLRKAATHYDPAMRKVGAEALRQHGSALLEQGNSEDLAVAILSNPEIAAGATPTFLLRLGGKLETSGSWEQAMRCYRAVYSRDSAAPETEMALARLARLTEQNGGDKAQAAAVWAELLRVFPYGPQAANAESALRRLGKPTVVFSAGSGGSVTASIPAPLPEGLSLVASPAMTAAASAEPTAPTGDSVHELAPIAPSTPWGGGNVASAVEAAYGASKVSGMTLRPLGNPTEARPAAPADDGTKQV